MARPLRSQWKSRTSVRARHKSWMRSIVLATAGWGVWWTSLVLNKLAPSWDGWGPGFTATYTVACSLTLVGFFYALISIRARRVWVLLAGFALLANGSMLLLPVVLGDPTTAFHRWAQDEPARETPSAGSTEIQSD